MCKEVNNAQTSKQVNVLDTESPSLDYQLVKCPSACTSTMESLAILSAFDYVESDTTDNNYTLADVLCVDW